jgi:hypothetical protein
MELGRSTQAFAELAGRTEGLMTDVIMALVFMSDLQQVSGFLRLLWFPPPMKLITTI